MSQKREDTGEVHRLGVIIPVMQKLLLCYIVQMICMIMYICLPHLSYLSAVELTMRMLKEVRVSKTPC